jgi:hypothetical protein
MSSEKETRNPRNAATAIMSGEAWAPSPGQFDLNEWMPEKCGICGEPFTETRDPKKLMFAKRVDRRGVMFTAVAGCRPCMSKPGAMLRLEQATRAESECEYRKVVLPGTNNVH